MGVGAEIVGWAAKAVADIDSPIRANENFVSFIRFFVNVVINKNWIVKVNEIFPNSSIQGYCRIMVFLVQVYREK